MGVVNFSWTDEATADLRKLVADGHAFSAIAEMIGGKFPKNGKLTRNACIGKANRMGLVQPRKTRPQQPAEQKRAAQAQVADYVAAAQREARKPPPPPARKPVATKPPPKQAEPAEPAALPAPPPPTGDSIGFFDMRDGRCKFPVGPTPQKGQRAFDLFRACGAESKPGQPYCAFHRGVVYIPLSARKRPESRSDGHKGGFKLPKMWIDA